MMFPQRECLKTAKARHIFFLKNYSSSKTQQEQVRLTPKIGQLASV